MANFDCQLDHIQNQLKLKVQGTPVRDFLGQVFWSRKTHVKCGQHLLVAALEKGGRRRKFISLPACLCSCWWLHPSCDGSNTSLIVEPISSWFYRRLVVSKCPLTLEYHIRTVETSRISDRGDGRSEVIFSRPRSSIAQKAIYPIYMELGNPYKWAIWEIGKFIDSEMYWWLSKIGSDCFSVL